MTGALPIVQAVVSLSFLALGLSTVIDWLRRRERSIGYLALALGTLGLTSILGQLNPLTDYRLGTLIGDITLVLLMTSGYALLLFRDSFIPLSRQLRIGALILCVGTTATALVVMVQSPRCAWPSLNTLMVWLARLPGTRLPSHGTWSARPSPAREGAGTRSPTDRRRLPGSAPAFPRPARLVFRWSVAAGGRS